MRHRVATRAVPAALSGDDGSSIIEFVGASVILLIPLVYVLLAVFEVQRGSFGVTQAAREAGRAFATAPSTDVGLARAAEAAQIAMADQGVTGAPTIRFTAEGASCAAPTVDPSLRPGVRFTVCVSEDVHLPFAEKGFLRRAIPATVHVVGRYALTVDTFRAAG